MGDEGSSSKLDNLSKDDLVKLVKKYIILHKQLRTKNEDLNKEIECLKSNSNGGSEQTFAEVNKDLNEKIEELSKANQELSNENAVLKEKIQFLNVEIENLHSSLDEYKSFKLEIEPQLENAQQEISLNKSMLEMLNNEIKFLNTEKLQLEKRLINNRRMGKPSIIVEEDEEDLEEEERIGDSYVQNELQSIAEEETEEGEIVDNYKKGDFDRDVDFIHHSNLENCKISNLNKQIEDMTFYIDELKSELEAEKEKNVELSSEIETLSQKLIVLDETNKIESNESNTNPENLKIKFENFLIFIRDNLVLNETGNEFIGDLNDLEKDVVAKLNEKISIKNSELSKEVENRKYLEFQLEKVIQNFKQEVNNMEIKIENLTKSKQEVENKLKNVENEFQNEIKNYKKYEKEASKSKVLDLEIADYEKSIKSLNVQIIAKDKEINDLKHEVNTIKENTNNLNKQIENLERERDDEKEKSTKLKHLLVKAKKDVSDAKTHESEHLNTEAQLKAQLESLNLEVENYKIQLAELSTDRQKIQDKLHSMSDTYNRSNQLLETKSQAYLSEIDDLKHKLSNLQNEFDNYKLKVQHVFKKQKEQNEAINNQTTNGAEIQKYTQEIEQLKKVIVNLTENIDHSQEKFKILEKENEITQEEYSRVLERNTKLINELKEKENEWKYKAEEIINSNSSRFDEINETIRTLKIENEALVIQHKERIRNLNSQHLHNIDSLQIQLDESRREIERLNRALTELKNKSPSPGDLTPNNSLVQLQSINVNTLSPRNNFIIGNESQSSDSEDNRNSLKTLEQLLSEPSPQLIPETGSDSKYLLGQINQLKTDLNKSKMQLDHLNELLNDSELNNARLSEQINLLKEEIRRLERNQEREKSISNMEYLKNVVFKFMTLSTPQERSQLLPVLTTMLKLSQEEQNAIMNFSKNTHTDSQNSGWTTYLPKWSS